MNGMEGVDIVTCDGMPWCCEESGQCSVGWTPGRGNDINTVQMSHSITHQLTIYLSGIGTQLAKYEPLNKRQR